MKERGGRGRREKGGREEGGRREGGGREDGGREEVPLPQKRSYLPGSSSKNFSGLEVKQMIGGGGFQGCAGWKQAVDRGRLKSLGHHLQRRFQASGPKKHASPTRCRYE